MTPSIVAFLSLLASGAAWSAPDYSAVLSQSRPLYAFHEVGQKTLDQSLRLPPPQAGDTQGAQRFTELQTLFMAARDVQEGCVRPCSTPAEVLIYREKARLVATKLGFDAASLQRIDERYLPKGQPRLKPAGLGSNPAGSQLEADAVVQLLSGQNMSDETRRKVNQRALALADALGRGTYIQADGAGIAALPGGRSVRLTPQQIADLNRIPRAQAESLRTLATKAPPSPILPGKGGTPAQLSVKQQQCIAAVNGPDPNNPEHSSIAKMCVDNPNWGPVYAPLLAGMLDAVKEQFGTVAGIVTNIIFLILGLVMSVATGGVALILKLLALIAAGWAIYKLIANLVSAAARADLRQIGFAGGTLLIMIMMALVGFGIGKTKPGASAIKSMENGMAAAMDKVGLTGMMGKLNSMLPAGMVAALEKVLGKAPPERTPGNKPSEFSSDQPSATLPPKATPVKEPPATLRAKLKSTVASLLGPRASGLVKRVSARIETVRPKVAEDLRGILQSALKDSKGEVTPAQYNQMFDMLVSYARKNGLEINGSGHWARELLLNGRTKGLYPQSPTMMDTVAFGHIKPGKAVKPADLHELAHMFHTIQMRVSLLRGGVTGEEAASFLKAMEGGASYRELEKAATVIGNPTIHRASSPATYGSRYSTKVGQLIDATDSALASGKVRIPMGWSTEECYAWFMSRATIVVGKSVTGLVAGKMPFVLFTVYYYNNIDVSTIPGMGTVDPETLKRIELSNPGGQIGFRDLVNAAIFGSEKKG